MATKINFDATDSQVRISERLQWKKFDLPCFQNIFIMKRNLPLFLFLSAVITTSLYFFQREKKFDFNYELKKNNEAKEEQSFDYFYAQRGFPYGKIDYDAQHTAANYFLDNLNNQRDVNSAWQFAGPENIGGRVVDIEMNPLNPNTTYLAAATGGIFKSTDGGTNWFPIFDNESTLSIGDIAIAPSDTNIIYAGTGEANGGSGSLTYDANGIYKSTNGGSTWTNIGLNLTRITGKIAVNPTNSNIVFAATMGDLYAPTPNRGLYRTVDGGANWTRVLFGTDSTGAIDVVINPQNPQIVFAALWERTRRPNSKHYYGTSSGLWRSADGGSTWTQLSVGLPPIGGLYSRIGVDLCPSHPNVVFVKYLDSNYGLVGVYKSSNGGNSFYQTNDAALISNVGFGGYWYGKMKCDPIDSNTVYEIGFDMYKTTDGGNSWFQTFPGVHVDHHAIAISPMDNQFVMNGCDGGLHISYDGGNNWIHHEGLPITQFYNCELDNLNPNILIGGAQDNNVVATNTGAFNDWNYLIGGDGFFSLIDPVDDSHWYGEYQYGNMSRSDDGGQSFWQIMNGLSGSGNWRTPIVFNPQNPQILYTGYQQVFKTNDRGDNWFSISPDLTTIDPFGNLFFGSITTIDVSPMDTNIIYAGTDDGKVWRTLNGGTNWLNVTDTLPYRWVTRVTCDEHHTNRAFVTMSGYRFHDNMSHVYMTNDNGTTWNSIDGNLPDVPCSDLIIDPSADSVLYLATDVGVFFTTDLGAAWNPIGTSMPVVVCSSLRLHDASRTLLVGTYGRGMYKLNLTSLAGVSPIEISLNSVHVFPNPATNFTTVSVQNLKAQNATVQIFDLTGKQIQQIFSGELQKGKSTFNWKIDHNKISSGIYLCVIEFGARKKTMKIIVE